MACRPRPGAWYVPSGVHAGLLLMAAALAGCGSSSPTGTGSSGSSITVSGQPSDPYDLNVPGGGTDTLTLAQLEGALDAAKPAQAGQTGALGVVTQVGASGFTLEQRLLLGTPADAPDGLDVHNYAPLGDPGSALSITTNGSTVFDGGATLASLPVGALVVVNGTESAGTVTASYVSVLDGQNTVQQSSVGRSPAHASTPPRARPRVLAAGVIDTIPGALGLTQNFPPRAIDEPVLVWSAKGAGACPRLEIHSQLGVGFGLRYRFPYDVIYNREPPLYGRNDGTWVGPGTYAGWLAFQGEPAAGSNMTVNYGGGMAVGVSAVFVTCSGQQIQVAAATAGYFLASTMTKAMPGSAQSDTLTTSSCQSFITFNLFVQQPEGAPDFAPFGGASNFQIGVCDPAIVTGAPVMAQLTNLLGGTGGGQLAFDPVSGEPTTEPSQLTPTDSTMLFDLSSLSYTTTLQDRLQISAMLAGQTLPTGTAASVFAPRTLTATAQPEHLQIFATLPTQICMEVPADQFDTDASDVSNPACSPVINYGPGNHTGTPIAVDAVVLCNASYCPASTADQTVSSSVTVTIRESGYQGVFRALDTPGAVPQVATVLYAVYSDDATICGNPAYQITNPITISAPNPSGNVSQTTFTISAGSWTTGSDMCHIYLVDENYGATILNVRLLGHS